MDRLAQFALHINETKSQICLRQVNFLRFAINLYGLKLQLEKLSEIVNFKSPKNANELKSFLGVIGFLRKFINECAILTAPLYDLLKKNKRFMWDDLCEINFRNLKQKVAEADTSILPKFFEAVYCIL